VIFRPELAELVEKILAGETEAARILEPGYVPDVLARLLDATIKTYLNLAVYEQDFRVEEERRRIAKALPSAGSGA
jgi:hypothetical protein